MTGFTRTGKMSLGVLIVFPMYMITISGMTEVTVTGKVGFVWKTVSNHTT